MPENAGSSPKRSIIFFVVSLGEDGCFPPPVFLLSEEQWLCSFFATLTIALHFSLTSATVLLQTPNELTFWVMSSHILALFRLVKVEENLLLIMVIFFSASSKMVVHSEAEKLALRHLFRPTGSTFSSAIVYKKRARSDKICHGNKETPSMLNTEMRALHWIVNRDSKRASCNHFLYGG